VTADDSHDLASDFLRNDGTAAFLLTLLVATPVAVAVARRVLIVAQVTFMESLMEQKSESL